MNERLVITAFGRLWKLLLNLGIVTLLTGCQGASWERAFSADPSASQWNPTPSETNAGDPSEAPADPPSAPPATDSPKPLIGPMPPAPSPNATPQADRIQAPPELRDYWGDLQQLGVLTAADEAASDFDPNAVIQRRTFARWLLVVNNRFYRDRSSRQIRPAVATATPIFTDVPASDPDFAAIQGLADAGYIPSPLTGDTQQVRFQPDAPLTRETLLIWKVPLDLQRLLPTGTAAQVQELWGFQDANRIGSTALSAVLADHENGDLANIRRLLGSSLLLQPQRPVTHAEAAATLWFIGVQGEGVSAKDVLRAERQSASQAENSAPPRSD